MSEPTSRGWREKSELWLSAGLVILLGLLAYTPFLGRLGFYQEDWYLIWSGVNRGPASLIPIFTADRPLIGYVFAFLYPILGENPLNWQVYALALRILGGLVLLWILRMLWPERKLETTAIAALFLIYPGFLQQPQAMTFQIDFTDQFAALLSTALTILSVRVITTWKRVALITGALLLSAFTLWLVEYAIGLEGLRLALLWVALQRRQRLPWRQALTRLVKWYLPYALLAAGFLYWRFFVFASARPTTDSGRLIQAYRDSPLYMLLRLAVELARGWVQAVFMAWAAPLYEKMFQGGYSQAILAGLLVVVAMLVLGFYFFLLRRQQSRDDEAGDQKTSLSWLVIGVLASTLALLPIIAANRSLNFTDRNDRYTLQASIGVAILVVGLAYTVLKPRLRVIALALLVGVSIATHYYQGYRMADFWSIQKDVWWQLSWRAPKISPGTLLLVNLPQGFSFAEGYEAWAPADLVYYHQDTPPVITGEVLYADSVYQVARGAHKEKIHRGIALDLQFDHPLVLSLPDRLSCLNVYDGRKFEFSVSESSTVRLVAPYSKIEQIQPGEVAQIPPREIFGPEPMHGWCYFYQQAMLARQQGDWQAIARLGDEALRRGLEPYSQAEWVVFLEGYASTGRLAEAEKLVPGIKSEFGMRDTVCRQLEVAPDYPSGYAYDQIVKILCKS